MYPSIEQCKKRIKIIDLELESLMQSYGDISRKNRKQQQPLFIITQVVKKMVEQDLISDEDASYLAEELEKECE